MKEKKIQWQCRIASSLGDGFAGTPNEVWGTKDYKNDTDPTVFFGLYGLPDFYALWKHKGRKAILWAGSDIKHFLNGYWLDKEGKIRVDPRPFAKWINENCECYVENVLEQGTLMILGVESKVIPSFLGNVEKYEPCFIEQKRPQIYTSVSGNDFQTYGWHKIKKLALDNPNIDFHLFGNTECWNECSNLENVFVRGRLSQEEMDKEIKEMTGALRLTEFDGFSELVAKSLLWGQWPISIIKYPNTLRPEEIDLIPQESNLKGREELLSIINKYPWNINI